MTNDRLKEIQNRFDKIFQDKPEEDLWVVARLSEVLGNIYEYLLPCALKLRKFEILAGKTFNKETHFQPEARPKKLKGDLLIKKDGKIYFCEAKNWVAPALGNKRKLNFKTLENKNPESLKAFLTLEPGEGKIKVDQKLYDWHGKILLWWDITDDKKEIQKIKEKFNLKDVLSIKLLLSELICFDSDGEKTHWNEWTSKMTRVFGIFQNLFLPALPNTSTKEEIKSLNESSKATLNPLSPEHQKFILEIDQALRYLAQH